MIDTQLIRIYGWEPTQHPKYLLGSCRWWGPRAGDVGLGVFQWIPKDYNVYRLLTRQRMVLKPQVCLASFFSLRGIRGAPGPPRSLMGEVHTP